MNIQEYIIIDTPLTREDMQSFQQGHDQKEKIIKVIEKRFSIVYLIKLIDKKNDGKEEKVLTKDRI